MLDRTNEIQTPSAEAEGQGAEPPRAEKQPRFAAVRRPLRAAWSFFISQSFSSLTRRIVSSISPACSRWSSACSTSPSSAPA